MHEHASSKRAIHENELSHKIMWTPHKPTDSVKIYESYMQNTWNDDNYIPTSLIILKDQYVNVNYAFDFWIVDVWAFHCTDEADAQTETYEGPLWGQNSHPAVGIPGTNSMVRCSKEQER